MTAVDCPNKETAVYAIFNVQVVRMKRTENLNPDYIEKISGFAVGFVMDTAEMSKPKLVSRTDDADKSMDDELQQLVHTLPREQGWRVSNLYLYQGFWCTALFLKPVISFQTHFRAFDSDVIIVTFPKCGTTWLKALTFSTLYRHQFAKDEDEHEHPLLNFTPHQLVRFLEHDVYLNNPCPDLESVCVYKPRVLPPTFLMLPCPLPLKTPTLGEENQEPLSLEKVFDKFCRGVCIHGPLFDQVLGYWNASRENPEKILFLKYEDLKEDIVSQLKHLAMFLGVPFTEDEEKRGVVEEIAKICSFEKLQELEVNKKDLFITGIPNENFFRKGEVGDWSNYLTPAMVERLEKLMQDELGNSGLTFNLSSKTS
ncbi:RNA-directed DNA polymerase (Reverse transcriptase), Ribonuclease H [Hibiscus syriacus]|uniref:Sulfotransferase n=1 Tax=Hibiscus syriacus TaxID=106335 RepID=A0A6A3C4E8_HIBSY|nr:RNA-directed DNA polymerase (Reverse transcriptase), Ribonuclease H [Hibiscus syriacus]